jgi:energy-coupling factor transporter ATP-binding protein EcfA2
MRLVKAPAAPDSPPDIFISFVQTDQAWGDWIKDVLREAGRSAVTGRDVIPSGAPIESSLTQAIKTSRKVVVVLSGRTTGSPWVRAELALAEAASKAVIAVVVDEEATIPTELANAAVVRLTDSSLAAGREALLDAVDEHTGGAHIFDAGGPNEIPPLLPTYFVDRQHEMALLEGAFLGDRSGSPATVVLTGPLGVGKTTLAAMFAQLHESAFSTVHWLRPRRHPPAIEYRSDVSRSGARNPGLLVIDDVDDYESVAGVLSSTGPDHVLLLSRSGQWARPFQIVALGPLPSDAAVDLVRRVLPDLDHGDAERIVHAAGGMPWLLRAATNAARTRSVSGFLDDTRMFDELLRASQRGRGGYYYLDTDDPRAISEFERALEDALGTGGSGVDLLDRERGSWRRWWQKRYPEARLDEIADRVERAAEVAALTKPEGEANRNNAEAVARLMEASAAIPNLVVLSGSVLLVKVTDSNGPRLVSKTLTATELRRFEAGEQLLANPARALNFLQGEDTDRKHLPPG